MDFDPGDFVRVTGSSNINSVMYNGEESKLYLEFSSGRSGSSIYEYLNVPEDVYNDFLDSDSKGKYVHNYIKGRYEYNKIS